VECLFVEIVLQWVKTLRKISKQISFSTTYNIMDDKKIGTGKAEATRNSNHNLIEVMKPFVSFGVKALTLLGSVLVHIVKSIPRPHDHKPASKKNNKVIKI
jgi:hypothetical protein